MYSGPQAVLLCIPKLKHEKRSRRMGREGGKVQAVMVMGVAWACLSIGSKIAHIDRPGSLPIAIDYAPSAVDSPPTAIGCATTAVTVRRPWVTLQPPCSVYRTPEFFFPLLLGTALGWTTRVGRSTRMTLCMHAHVWACMGLENGVGTGIAVSCIVICASFGAGVGSGVGVGTAGH